ncbi:MAG: methyltransferase domain-containing protein [bacterium]|nr:methyltransferase domain-containing protein [bacterium]
MKNFSYFILAIKNFREVGNFIPSQRFLINKLVSPISKDSKYILELGAGEGCVTKEIGKRVNDSCKIISFEINPDIIKLSNIDRKNTFVINDDVLNVKNHLDKFNIKKIDYIVSSLPLAQINNKKIDILLKTLNEYLKDDGFYIQYQYSVLSLKTLKKHYKDIKIKFTPFNLPPAFVYICKK